MSCLAYSNCGFANDLPEPQLHTLKIIQSSDELVSHLLRGTRPLLDDDIALFDVEIVELNKLWSFYDAQLEEIQSRLRSVSKGLEKRRSIYAPIRRLPREILTNIFHLVCDSWWQDPKETRSARTYNNSLDLSGPLWVLGRVCGLWRDALHTSPVSWARNVEVSPPFSRHASEVLQTYLERTGEHPLNLRAVCYDGNGMAHNREIIYLIIQSCYLWKNVCLYTHPHYLRSISHLPFLQTVELYVLDGNSDNRLDMCLNAPQLWRATIPNRGIHLVRLPPTITHYSGCIDCEEDLRILSHLPRLGTCYLLLERPSAEFRLQMPVVMTKLRHLYVDNTDTLNALTAPLLESLTISESPPQGSPCINSFLRRSGCHLESLSYSMRMPVFCSVLPASIGNVLSLEACSTISRLKLELGEELDEVAEVLTLSSVLPNLHHLILCLKTPPRGWYLIRDMLRSCRDVGLIKSIELQFKGDGPERRDKYDRAVAEIRGLTGDNLEMQIKEWNPPSREYSFVFSYTAFD
ncbi:hypothetical protein EDD18DRAFT_1166266 [Armillaria luteobubalina]|uniref:F-box domain-containing protein n=1 Tax=Armillaria luteobubalina TaxID=153913 RepID=A0AA39UNB4_9AGAR|nr:hypothetical protein EDD18DRAFT_1166266 [Armillaria luteobubalina]